MDRSIGELLAGISFSSIQEALTIYDWLEQKGKTVEDLREYVQLVCRVTKIITKEEAIRPCPECSSHMRLHPGDSPENCVWACAKCRFSEYVPQPMRDEVYRLIKEKENIENGSSNKREG